MECINTYFSTLVDIQFQELFAIVVACEMFGNRWKNKNVVFYCDNNNIVWNIKKHRTHLNNESVMSLIRYMTLCTLKYDFNIAIEEISSSDNKIADQLSRFQPYSIPVSGAKLCDCTKVQEKIIQFVSLELRQHTSNIDVN